MAAGSRSAESLITAATLQLTSPSIIEPKGLYQFSEELLRKCPNSNRYFAGRILKPSTSKTICFSHLFFQPGLPPLCMLKIRVTFSSLLAETHVPKSENHRTLQVGRDLWRSSRPSLSLSIASFEV